jgi:hypothetical protein
LREAALAVAAEATDRLEADLIECLNPTAPIGCGCGPIFSDRNVWCGRALQESFVDLSACGLASMYPASDWSVLCAPGHHGNQRALRSH